MNFTCDYTLCSWLCIGLFHAVFLGLTHIVTHFETSFLCLTNTTLYEYYILFSRVSDEHEKFSAFVNSAIKNISARVGDLAQW